MENIEKILSDNLRRLRKRLNLTQAELAHRANLSTQGYQYYERNERWPSKQALVRIAEALNVEVADLFQLESNATPNKHLLEALSELEAENRTLKSKIEAIEGIPEEILNSLKYIDETKIIQIKALLKPGKPKKTKKSS